MFTRYRQLRQKQLDRVLRPLRSASPIARPRLGWVRALREASGISSADMADRLGASRQLVLQQEKAEAEDRITLKSLRRLADALDCELVYALLPRGGRVQSLVEKPARSRARKNVLNVEHTMALEDQAAGHLAEAMESETRRLLRSPSAR